MFRHGIQIVLAAIVRWQFILICLKLSFHAKQRFVPHSSASASSCSSSLDRPGILIGPAEKSEFDLIKVDFLNEKLRWLGQLFFK